MRHPVQGRSATSCAEEMDDAALVERVRRGDVSAYDTLVQRHEALCFRTAYGITGDAEEARDAAQDAFVKAYFNLARFRAGAPFRPWIVRITANEARNRRVAAGRRQGLVQRVAVAGGLSTAGEGGALDGQPGDAALGAPDEVFHSAAIAGGQVSFVYHAGAGAPPAPQTGVALLVSQFRGALEPELYSKMLGPHTRLERLTVEGGRALWMEGAPHAVIVRTPEGQIFVDQARLAANVLAWEREGLTLRLEGALDRPTALRLATSFR